MTLLCLSVTLCCDSGSLEGLRLASAECATAAAECRDVADDAASKGRDAVRHSNDVRNALSSLKKVDLSTLGTIHELVRDKKVRQVADIVGEMDDIAGTAADKASRMTESIRSAIESLPDYLKEELAAEEKDEAAASAASRSASSGAATENDDDDDEVAVARLLESIDAEVDDVEVSARSMERVDIFSAAVEGVRDFDTVSSKETTCATIFERIKSMSASILRLMSAFAGSGGCCEQAHAINAGLADLFKCARLSELIRSAAEAARKLLCAIGSFFKRSWTSFQNFVEQFEAAKRLGKFINGINPMNLFKNNSNNNDTKKEGKSSSTSGGRQRPSFL